MKRNKLGASDIAITPVTIGTWALGGWLWGGTEKNEPIKAIHAGLDGGINCVDTAPVYGFGLSEELVGRALGGRRSDVVLATKCGLVWDDRPGGTDFFETTDVSGKPLTVKRCLRKASILQECDASLQRLQTDVIDLYQCHWPDERTPFDDTMEALLTLRDQGKIRAFGVSNFSAEQVAGYCEAGVVSNQVKYSLLSRDIEPETLPFCREHDVAVLAYSPMEMGLLTGTIGVDHEFPKTDTRRTRPWFQPDNRQAALDALEKIKPIADRLDVTLAQLSVAWICAQPGITSTLVGSRTEAQARSNAAAGALELFSEDVSAIRAVFEPLHLDQAYDPATAKR